MIIGLHGKMGSGKNTAALRLAQIAPPVVEVSFAAKLKESAAALIGCTVADLELWKNDPSKCVAVGGLYDGLGFQQTRVFTVREYLQRYGTEAHRDVFGADFWLDAALPVPPEHRGKIADWYGDALYVVTDVRFPNEAVRVRELGGIVVGVRGPETDTGNHASEQVLDCDVWIDNTARDDGFAALDGGLRNLLRAYDPALAA